MGVVDDDREIPRPADDLQTTRGGLQLADGHQSLLRIGPYGDSRAVDGENVIGVVLPDKPCPGLPPVDLEQHPLEGLLHNAAGVVCDASAGISHHLCLGVLHHHLSVLVIDVGDRGGRGRKVVEEQFLAAEIFSECLVIVEMVVGQVREYSDLELESSHSFLLHADRTDFHEAELAAGVHHLAHKTVDGDRVGCCVGRLQTPGSNIVGYCGKQSAVVPLRHEKVIEKGHRGGLPVGPRDSDKREFPGRIVEEIRRHHRHGVTGVLDFDECKPSGGLSGIFGNSLVQRFLILIDNRRRT